MAIKLEIKNLYKIFGEHPQRAFKYIEQGLSKEQILEKTGLSLGVKDASLAIEEGEIFVIMGLSGSGKSTMVRLLNRLIEPTRGQVLIDGVDIAKISDAELREVRRKKIAMVFQSFALMPHMTVLDNTAFGMELAGINAEERREKALDALRQVGLENYAHSYPDELSGGMRQRVGLARALAINPDILLMDEAFSALDPLIRTEMQDELVKLQAKHQRTIVFISHDLDEAMRIGDRIAIMQNGEVVQVGTPDEILNNPANDYVRTFFRGVDISQVFSAKDIARRTPNGLIRKTPGFGPRSALKLLQDEDREYGYVIAQNNTDYKRMLRIFQEALDLQEHISVSLHQPEEVQKLVERSHAEEVIRWNAQTVAARLRVLADDILYHRLPTRFTMEKQIGALEKIARQHPDNPVGQFCYWHFSRIARVLRTQKPLYARDLLADKQRRMPLLPALKSYLSLKSPALRNAGRLSVMLSVASLMGTALHLPKSYWILMTVLLVTQNGYGATRLRIVNRSVGTVVGLIIAGVALHFKIPEGYTLTLMLITTLASYLILRKNYGWATVGFTITAVYTLQLLWLNGEQYILPRLIDTIIGCLIAFGGTVWLWPQWQSGLLRKNAHDALEAYQEAIRLILSEDPQPTPLAWQRMRVNQAHNTLYNSLNQAMQEPAFNSHYLADMKLWVTHSQFIVEHINAMTTLAREHRALPPELAQEYLQSCEIAIQRCQQRLEYDEPGSSGDANIMDAPEMQPHEGAAGTLEQHLQRVIGHLNTMHTISSMAWRQRPHHGIWLSRKLRDSKA